MRDQNQRFGQRVGNLQITTEIDFELDHEQNGRVYQYSCCNDL